MTVTDPLQATEERLPEWNSGDPGDPDPSSSAELQVVSFQFKKKSSFNPSTGPYQLHDECLILIIIISLHDYF